MTPACAPAPSATNPTAHLSDGALLRLLDGEAAPAEQAVATAHLAGCVPCRARRDVLAGYAAGVSTLLAEADAPTPAFTWADIERRAVANASSAQRRSGGMLAHRRAAVWRALAAVACAAGVAAAAPAVARWTRARALGGVAATAAPARDSLPPAGTVTAVSFEALGPELTVALDAPQRTGALEIRGGAGSAIRAEVLGDRNTARLLVLPGELRVGNAPEATASYRVTVPPTVRRVRVQVAGAEVAVIRAPAWRAGPVRRERWRQP